MKTTLAALCLSLVAASSAFASDYKCRVEVQSGEQTIGATEISQEYGTSLGDLTSILIQKKKNLVGKTVETLELRVNGAIQNQAKNSEDAQNCSLKAAVSFVTSDFRGSTIKTKKTQILDIDQNDDVSARTTYGKYTVNVNCLLTK